MENNNKKILVVEDDAFVMDIYRTKLTREGFAVAEAKNGVEAVKYLEKNMPDLMLLDIVMPYMDGLAVLEKMNENEKWKNIPVILLTNLSQKEEVERCLRLGAKDYLIKSHFTPAEVVEKIRTHLTGKTQ